MTELLTPAAVLARLAGGFDDTAFGVAGTRPDGGEDGGARAGAPVLVALRLTGEEHEVGTAAGVAAALRSVPVVLVGVAEGQGPLPEAGAELDVLLCEQDDPPRPWVGSTDGAVAELERLEDAVVDSPDAAVALVQLLRVTEAMSTADAVVAESFVYSLLQAGECHQRWLASRRGRRTRPRPEHPVVRVDRRGATLAVTLDRPEVRNAYGSRMRDELVEALLVAEVDRSVERVELRGAGPAFCSGGDLDEFGTAADPVSAHGVRTTRSAGVHLARIADRVTAFVHGACVGAGVELPAFAGEVVARADATFLLPEVGMGLVPGAGGTSSVPRRVGRHRAAHLALAGRPVDAPTALSWGLVDRIDPAAFPDPLAPGSCLLYTSDAVDE